MFFALVVKKPDKGEFEITEEALKLAEDEEFIQQSGPNPGEARSKKTKLLPPDQAKLIAMRAARMKERKMYSVIREIVTFYVFLALLLMIAYTHRDQIAYHQTKNLYNEIGGGDFSNVSIEHTGAELGAEPERILFPRGRAPFGQHQELRPLAGPIF